MHRVSTMKAQPIPASATSAIDLGAAARALHGDEARALGSHGAHTLVREPDLRVVLVALAPGGKMSDHHVKDTATLQVLEGKIRVGLPGRDIELRAGQLFAIEHGLQHDVEGLERSSVLLTLTQLRS